MISSRVKTQLAALGMLLVTRQQIERPDNRRPGELVKGLSSPPPVKNWVDRRTGKRVKVPRNAKCPCGSGQKFKACCLGKVPIEPNESG